MSDHVYPEVKLIGRLQGVMDTTATALRNPLFQTACLARNNLFRMLSKVHVHP